MKYVLFLATLVFVADDGWAWSSHDVDTPAGGLTRWKPEQVSLSFQDDGRVLVRNQPKPPAKSKGDSTVAWDPTWDSIDSRPLPDWYDEAKIGIFIHWGVYAVPGVSTEWFWWHWKVDERPEPVEFMRNNYPPGFTYQDFGPQFNAEFYNATRWVELFKKAGAKYVVLTSKHHDGFTLWPSKYSFGWNAVDVGAHRDVLGELASAVRENSDLKFGLYYSLYEWFHPQWLADKESNFQTDDFVQHKTMPALYELVNAYAPEVIWSDGEWDADSDYWQSKEFLAWLYNDSPVKDTVVTNDRWGRETLCEHGGYYTCTDRYNPGVLQPRKWENCMTLDYGWGYSRNAQYSDYMTPQQLIRILIETVSCGGNLLVNVGPTKDGVIVPMQEERLLQMGEWLEINGAAIYSSDPWTHQNDTVTPGVWYTTTKDKSTVYAMLTFWPTLGQVDLGAVNAGSVTGMQVLGSTGTVSWFPSTDGIRVQLPARETVASQWAYTVAITIPA